MTNENNLFCIDLDCDDQSTDFGDDLIIRRPSDDLRNRADTLNDQLGTSLEKSLKRAVYSIVIPAIPFAIGFVLLLHNVGNYLDGEGFSTLWAAISALFIAIAIPLLLFFRSREKKEDEDPNSPISALAKQYEELDALTDRDLQIPSDAAGAEVLMYFHDKSTKANTPYENVEIKIFGEGNNLCLLYDGVVFGIPKESITEVVHVEEPVTLANWNKDVSYNRGDYLQYKIVKKKKNDEEVFIVNDYYAIRFTHGQRPFELFIPPYEIAAFLDVLKMDVTNA